MVLKDTNQRYIQLCINRHAMTKEWGIEELAFLYFFALHNVFVDHSTGQSFLMLDKFYVG